MKKERLQKVEVIPYKSFKEKIRITKELDRKARITIEPEYIIAEKVKWI